MSDTPLYDTDAEEASRAVEAARVELWGRDVGSAMPVVTP